MNLIDLGFSSKDPLCDHSCISLYLRKGSTILGIIKRTKNRMAGIVMLVYYASLLRMLLRVLNIHYKKNTVLLG